MDLFLKNLLSKDDELVMSEMQKMGGHRLHFGEKILELSVHPRCMTWHVNLRAQ